MVDVNGPQRARIANIRGPGTGIAPPRASRWGKPSGVCIIRTIGALDKRIFRPMPRLWCGP